MSYGKLMQKKQNKNTACYRVEFISEKQVDIQQ